MRGMAKDAFQVHCVLATARKIINKKIKRARVRIPPPTSNHGRRQQFSDATIQACLTLKVLLGMPLRQTAGFVESFLKVVGLSWEVPDFSTLSRHQKTLSVNLPYRRGTGPLNLLIDSTGDKASGMPASTEVPSGVSGARYKWGASITDCGTNA